MGSKTTDISKHFSQEALETLLKACESAHQKGQKVCTSAHLFCILTENPNIQQLFSKVNIDYAKILAQLEPILRNATYPIAIKTGRVIFSTDLRITILRSYLISTKIITQAVGLEELLLASLYSPEIYRIIKRLNMNLKPLSSLFVSEKGGQVFSKKAPPTSARFITDITKLARDGDLEEIVNRDAELAQLTRILVRRTKNNVILLGENGVGRSAIVHLLAQKIASGHVAPKLHNTQILKLNISALISAVTARDVTDLLNSLQEDLRKTDNAIIFIKNFETALGDSSIEGTIIINLLKSLISEGAHRFIVTMNTTAYRELAAKERDISQRFESVKIKEPSLDLAVKILESVSKKLSQYHKIIVGTEVIQKTVQLAKRYIQDKHLPSKAIDLLDEASSKVVLENRPEVTTDDIKSIISEKTGIPIEKVTVSEQKKLIDLEVILHQTVIGQEEAVHIVSEVIRRSRAGLKDPKKPIGSFLFLGPSGVGKTFLAQNLAKIVYDNEKAMLRLDMSEFGESHTVQRLIGPPPGYVGYGEGGQLTNPVWEQPYSLILLDEIEKAHPRVFDIFLQVLDEGRLTDGQGRTVDFKNTIIIATSNIASEEILNKLSKHKEELQGFTREKFIEEEIVPTLKLYFRPEFINRFDEIVIFKPLGTEELIIIARLQIAKIQKRLSEQRINLQVSESKLTELAQKAYKPAFGARPLIRLIQEQIENVLARKIISGEIKEGDTVNL